MFSAELPWCYLCAETKVLGMTWNFTEHLFRKYKKSLQKMKTRGPTTCPRGWGRACPPRAPPTPTRTLYIVFRGEKNQREEFIAFYDMEPPPSPKTSREGWSGVRSRLRRGQSVSIVIINHSPSPISWCSPPYMSNSIVGLLDGDGLDGIYHVIELVLLGFDP